MIEIAAVEIIMDRAERRRRTFTKQTSREDRLRFCDHFTQMSDRDRGRLKDTHPDGEPKCFYKGSRALSVQDRKASVQQAHEPVDEIKENRDRARMFLEDWFKSASRDEVQRELADLKLSLMDFKEGKKPEIIYWSQRQHEFWAILMEFYRLKRLKDATKQGIPALPAGLEMRV